MSNNNSDSLLSTYSHTPHSKHNNKVNKLQNNNYHPTYKKDIITTTNMKNIYAKLIREEKEKQRPFGKVENRFIIKVFDANDFNNNNNTKRKQYRFKFKHKDNLEGGIGMFMNTKQHQCDKNNSIDLTKRNLMIKKLNTKRVIIPNCDNNIKCALRKRRNKSSDVIQRYSEGSFESLMNKTPNSFDGKGKKIVKGYSNKSHDIFSNEFLNGDGKCNVFGMHRRKKRNLNIRGGLSYDNGNNGINKKDDYVYNRSLMSKNILTITRDSISGRNNNNTINTTGRFHRRNMSLPLKTISYM